MEDSLDSIRLNFGEGGLGVLTISLALIMFGVALHLRPADFFRILQQPKSVLTGLFAQFVALPAITVLLIRILHPAPSLGLGMLLVSCCPGGNMSNFLSLMARGHVALSVSLTAVSSALALILTPLNFQLWQPWVPGSSLIFQQIHLNPWSIMASIAMMLVLPLMAGMLLNAHFAEWAIRLRKPMNRLSLLIFFVFVVAAFATNASVFIRWAGLVFLLVLVHNALAFFTGYGIARIMQLDERDIRTISIETGIQNSGLALVLIFAHFDGLGGMALIAGWWGIWHIAAGMLISWRFGRLKTAVAPNSSIPNSN